MKLVTGEQLPDVTSDTVTSVVDRRARSTFLLLLSESSVEHECGMRHKETGFKLLVSCSMN
jgi:hypothetical protein